MATSIHIGNMLRQSIGDKNIRYASISRAIGASDNAVYSYEKRESLQTRTLLQLCHALKHNFFKDIAGQLPEEYDSFGNSQQDMRIAEQEERIKTLQLENNLLKELISKKM